MEKNIEKLKNWIEESDNIVFFGGAGVSTESGIPDFRSVDGLYNQKYDYPPETILSHEFFEEKPEEFYRFYRDKLLIEGAAPNKAHLALAGLERAGRLKAVITQNIDGLHQAAGSLEVLELHGAVSRNHCTGCGTFYDADYIRNYPETVPRCAECGAVIKPDVVLYGEPLDDTVMNRALSYISHAEMLIVGGTSLNVYPAAGLVRYYRGRKLVLINMASTPMDDLADLIIRDKIGEVLSCAVPE